MKTLKLPFHSPKLLKAPRPRHLLAEIVVNRRDKVDRFPFKKTNEFSRLKFLNFGC